MRHITKSNKPSVITARPGFLEVNIPDHLDEAQKKALYEVTDEIAEDLGNHNYTGRFSFEDGNIHIVLESRGEKRTWIKPVK